MIESIVGVRMKSFETGKDKIQKICDILKKETLEPAKQEAREIIENAHLQAAEIVERAKKEAEAALAAAEKEIEEKKRVFESSIHLACRQALEGFKQKIEERLFDRELAETVARETSDPKVIAHLLAAFMKSMETQGIEENFEVVLPKEITPRSINAVLASQILEKLKEQSVSIGDFKGGVQIKLTGRQITIDISDEVIREWIAQYIRRDFRDLIFNL